MMRMVVAESQLADRVFTVPYDEAAFTDVVKKSVNSMAQFGEGIVNGRRYAAVNVIDSAITFQPVLRPSRTYYIHQWEQTFRVI